MAICHIRRRALLSGVVILAFQSAPALAVEPASAGETLAMAQAEGTVHHNAASPAVDDAGANTTEDIVVTAQRRAEPLQKVPIAVTAIQPSQLKEQNITDLVSLRSKLATFDFRTSGHTAGIYLRGVGQNGAFPNSENSVAMYVDDIYMGLAQMTKAPFNNIEQLVVLKGPQGTLFGRNATGGVVQITTANPKYESALDASIGYATFDTVKGSVYVTGGLSDKIAANISAIVEDQGRGWGRNLFLNEDVHKKNTFGVRSKILFQPSENTDVLLSADYSFERNTGLSHRPVPGNPRFNLVPANIGFYDTYAGFDDSNYIRHGGGSLKLTQDLGFGSFVSITAYRKMRAFASVDQDGTPASQVSVHSFFGGQQFTQELQLLSNEDSKLKWTLGAFLFDADGWYKQDLFQASRHLESKQLTKSLAAYAQVTYPIFDGTNITGGLRYTNERQKLVDAFQIIGGVTRTNFPEKRSTFNRLTWRVSLDQQLTDTILAYVSYNRGIKTGGFNLGSPATPPFAPERLDAYEVGLKTQLFDRRVRFNVATFYYDYTDLQVTQALAGTTFATNAATARIYGVDGDIDIRVTDALSLFGSFGFLNSKYTSFPGAQSFTIAGTPIPGYDASGNDLIYAPHFTGSAGARYQMETDIGRLTFSANANHFSGGYGTADQQSRIAAYTLINASVEWRAPSGKFDVRLWGSNLTDKRWLAYAVQNGVGLNVVPGEPRTYGVTVGVHF